MTGGKDQYPWFIELENFNPAQYRSQEHEMLPVNDALKKPALILISPAENGSLISGALNNPGLQKA